MSRTKVWTVELHLEELLDHTDAKAVLRLGDADLSAWGRARRNPTDADIPAIGDELAAARALSELSHRLVDAAAQAIERIEGRSIHLQS